MEEERGRLSRDEAFRQTRFIKLIENNLSAGDATPARRRGGVDYLRWDYIIRLTRHPHVIGRLRYIYPTRIWRGWKYLMPQLGLAWKRKQLRPKISR
jgi:hypothetical protein